MGQLAALQQAQAQHERTRGQKHSIDDRNAAQHTLRAQFTPFISGLHAAVMQLDKATREMDIDALLGVDKRGFLWTRVREKFGSPSPWASLCPERRTDTFDEGHRDWKGSIWKSAGDWGSPLEEKEPR